MFGRIRTDENGGVWCPSSQISSDVYEWIQIDLGELTVVTQVETQGRFGNGQVNTDQLLTDTYRRFGGDGNRRRLGATPPPPSELWLLTGPHTNFLLSVIGHLG